MSDEGSSGALTAACLDRNASEAKEKEVELVDQEPACESLQEQCLAACDTGPPIRGQPPASLEAARLWSSKLISNHCAEDGSQDPRKQGFEAQVTSGCTGLPLWRLPSTEALGQAPHAGAISLGEPSGTTCPALTGTSASQSPHSCQHSLDDLDFLTADLASWRDQALKEAAAAAGHGEQVSQQAVGGEGFHGLGAVPADPSPGLPQAPDLEMAWSPLRAEPALSDARSSPMPPLPHLDLGSMEIMKVHSSCQGQSLVKVKSAVHDLDDLARASRPDQLRELGTLPAGSKVRAKARARGADSGNGGSIASVGSRDMHIHGAAKKSGIGFDGHGPFWTCSTTPQSREDHVGGHGASRSEDGKNSSSVTSHVQDLVGAALSHAGGAGVGSTLPVMAAAAEVSGVNTSHLASRISLVIGDCIDLLAKAIDMPADSAPPEEELTTVLLETKEQKLQWRDFLTETVSKRCASTLYKSYDVEAEPPRYVRPPLSTQQSSSGASSSNAGVSPGKDTGLRGPGPSSADQPKQKQVPHVVAPRGAGWSPLASAVRREPRAPSAPGDWWFPGCNGRTGLPEWGPSLAKADAEQPSNGWLAAEDVCLNEPCAVGLAKLPSWRPEPDGPLSVGCESKWPAPAG